VRIAVLNDVHGNVRALEAVLRDVDGAGVDAIVLGGDIFAGPWPAETYELLAPIENAIWIRGNADRELVEDGGRAPRELTAWSFRGHNAPCSNVWRHCLSPCRSRSTG